MPAPAVGFAPLVIVSGGQNFAQAPVQTMCPFFSLVMWYSVRPPAFTTNAPYFALFVLLTVPVCDPVAATATPAPTAARKANGTARRASRVHICSSLLRLGGVLSRVRRRCRAGFRTFG